MRREDSNRPVFNRTVGAVLAVLTMLCAPAQATDLERGRALFLRVYETVERGDWTPIDAFSAQDRRALEGYVLWPDLRATWLRANLDQAPAGQIEAFLAEHGTLRPARELRYRYALHLGRSGNLGKFQRIYERYYQGSDVATLDCLSLQAEIAAGRLRRVPGRGVDLWLIGRSQVKECDPVFEYLVEHGMLGEAAYRERFDLAIRAREFNLARWLGKRIDQAHVDTASDWLRARSGPQRFLASHDRREDGEIHREQLAYAAERLTYSDPVAARRLWEAVEPAHDFTDAERQQVRRHIALWTARDNLPDGHRLLAALPGAAQDDEVLRWRARTSLREMQWRRLLADVDAMTPAERTSEAWRYWRAVALQRTGRSLAARAALEALSETRSYYGFLAADELGRDYTLDHQTLEADEAVLAAVAATPDVIRARELFLVGLEGRGRSEWDAAVRRLTVEEKVQAAILADRWGWHSRAIALASGLGEYDDLSIRYPLPWQNTFESSSSTASIDPTWAYGVARSESLFMPDVRSAAGAIGLMQLLPDTGRRVARTIREPYSGLATLTDPAANIRLGTTYLAQMAARFGGNRVLATAAYNAGPHRIDEWLSEDATEDARAWIENIPLNETRRYVKRVLTAQTIFRWRMTGDASRLSDELPRIAAAKDLRLASR